MAKRNKTKTSSKALKTSSSFCWKESERQQLGEAKAAIGHVLKKWAKEAKERIERWAIEKIDDEAKVVRIERVKMYQKQYKELFKDKLSKRAASESDDLSLWDISTELTITIPLEKLRRKLSLRKDEALSENMVFWVLLEGQDSVKQVYHATQAARGLTQKLYKKVSGIEPGE